MATGSGLVWHWYAGPAGGGEIRSLCGLTFAARDAGHRALLHEDARRVSCPDCRRLAAAGRAARPGRGRHGG